MTEVKVNVHYLTRVEGHGNIVLNASNGKIEELRWEVTESPRLFEAMLLGRHYSDVSQIASRICGICSIAHSTASIQATEAAFNFRPSEQTVLLRRLLYDAELLESHILHVYFLVAPDYLGTGSVFPLIETHKDVVVRAIRLKKLAYRLAEIIAGRKTHPIALMAGGFARIPETGDLKNIRQEIVEAFPELEATAELLKNFKIPEFTRETEYIALKNDREYAFLSGQIASSDAGLSPLDNYLNITNEFCVPHSTAKYTRNKRESYMVGALARFNLNSEQLLPRAKKAAVELGLNAPCHNPFMIPVAQLVECFHAAEEAVDIIDALLSRGLREESFEIKVKAGRGIGAVEAPRGILFHDYTYNDGGIIIKANCVIPTNQNHNNIQKDMEALAPAIINKPEDEISQTLEMLVRAYDPCISCSTHVLKARITK